MPELPEVQTVVTTLAPRTLGRRIAAVRVFRQDIVTPPTTDLPALLTGRTIRSIERRGKRIIFTLDDATRFYIHLGMTGRLTAEPAGTPPAKHTHLVLDVGPDTQLHFTDPRRFGGIWWLGGQTPCDEGMGPEPLSMRASQLACRLARTRRPIKAALLDQRLIAGLGNIYVDESLFLAAIHPLTPANALSRQQVARLSRAIKRILRTAIRHRGSTLRDYRDANGQSGGFQDLHQVYGREDQPCPRCQTPLRRIVLGGRSTHFCPDCQRR